MKRYTFTETASELYKVVEGMDANSLVDLHNFVCSHLNDPYNFIYSMGEFSQTLDHLDAMTIANKIHHGEFNPYDDYFMLDPYANLFSFSSHSLGGAIDKDLIVETILENEKSFGFQEIQTVLDNYDGE